MWVWQTDEAEVKRKLKIKMEHEEGTPFILLAHQAYNGQHDDLMCACSDAVCVCV